MLIFNQMLKMKDLKTLAPGLNIEGGYPGLDCKTKWANLVLVLDRPLLGKRITFDELLRDVNDHKYPMLENGIPDINEPQFLTLYMAIIGYYLKRHDSMIIHIHQFPAQCGWLLERLQLYVKVLTEKYNWKRTVEYRTDNPFYSRQAYYCKNGRAPDIVLSLSQCAGLADDVSEGAFIVPDTFIPYGIEKKTVFPKRKYEVRNELVHDIESIMTSQHHDYAVVYHADYKSANPDKVHRVQDGIYHFFHEPLLQVSTIWNPTSDDELVTISDYWKPVDTPEQPLLCKRALLVVAAAIVALAFLRKWM